MVHWPIIGHSRSQLPLKALFAWRFEHYCHTTAVWKRARCSKRHANKAFNGSRDLLRGRVVSVVYYSFYMHPAPIPSGSWAVRVSFSHHWPIISSSCRTWRYLRSWLLVSKQSSCWSLHLATTICPPIVTRQRIKLPHIKNKLVFPPRAQNFVFALAHADSIFQCEKRKKRHDLRQNDTDK